MTPSDPWEDIPNVEPIEYRDSLVGAVRRDLEGLSAPPSSHLDTPRVVCWPRLNVDDAEAELHQLGEWIGWLVARYSLDHRTIPPCWQHHGAIIEELSALRSLWHACYGPDASPADPTNFHQRLGLAMQRLRDWTARRDCKPGQHREDQPPIWHGIDDLTDA
jgi:hypothetical protein